MCSLCNEIIKYLQTNRCLLSGKDNFNQQKHLHFIQMRVIFCNDSSYTTFQTLPKVYYNFPALKLFFPFQPIQTGTAQNSRKG